MRLSFPSKITCCERTFSLTRHSRYILGSVVSTVLAVQLNAAPNNDLLGSAAPLSGDLPLVVSADSGDATIEDWEQDFESVASVWWTWTATENTDVVVATTGSNYDTDLYIWESSANGFDLIDYNDDERSTTLTSRLRFSAQKGAKYVFRVGSWDATGGNVKLTLTAAEPWVMKDWTLDAPDGGTVTWSQFANQVVIFNIWATWCVPCLKEMPDLVRLQADYRDQGLAIVGIATDTTRDRVSLVQGVISDLQVNYAIAMGTEEVENMFESVNSIPTTYIISRSGRVVSRMVGSRSYSTFESVIKPLLAEQIGVISPPQLQLHLRGDATLELSWPKTNQGLVVQQAPALSGPWTDNSEIPRSLGPGLDGIEVNRVEVAMFFRLRTR